ncbi:PAS domain S-box protein [Filobacillus milosensis]|uniref:PAS domain S-box protein n=1 Tax=Filobacillus milosensis TaxID=94137 RepID=UPI0018912657|nr:PAS domain S-box protein [Filobacillus milosensis]
MFGWTKQEIVKQNLSIIADELNVMETLFNINQGKTITYEDVQRLHKNGHHIDVLVTVVPIQNNQDQIYGAMVIYRSSIIGKHD